VMGPLPRQKIRCKGVIAQAASVTFRRPQRMYIL
jgi:hypothetical protein